MKKTIFLISLVSIYFLVSCKEKETKTTIASNTTHLKSDTLKFEIDFPKTWNAIKNPENPKVIHLEKPLADSTSSEYAENIMIWSEQLPMNILDSIYHLTAIAQLKIKNPHLIITNNGAKKIGDKKFYQYSFDFTPDNSKNYRVLGYTFYNYKDSTAYNFNATFESKNNSLFTTETETILASFKTR